jgi:hypothetical protein
VGKPAPAYADVKIFTINQIFMLSRNAGLSLEDVKKEILEYCLEPHGPSDILEHIKVVITKNNYSKFITTLLDQRFIISTLLRKRNSANQKFMTTRKGLNYLKAIA